MIPIGDDSVAALSDAIRSGNLSNLEEIGLGATNIGDEGVKKLAAAIAEVPLSKLRRLDLQENDAIDDEGITALASVIVRGKLPALQALLVDHEVHAMQLNAACRALPLWWESPVTVRFSDAQSDIL